MAFDAIPYPISSPNPVAAADSAAGQAAIDRIVREIDNGPKDRVYVIAGHSSGGKLAGRVAEKVKNPQQVKLVILDGSRPSEAAKKRVSSTTCYLPRGTKPFNRGSMESCADVRTLPADRCRGNATCGHFALVNAEVMPGLRSYRADGYRRAGGGAGCRPNLDWVPQPSTVKTKYRPAVAGVTRPEVEGTR